MLRTKLEIILGIVGKSAINIFNNNLSSLSFSILSMLLGFFISTTLSTIPGQTGDWGIIGAAMIVTFYEITSLKVYKNHFRGKTQFILLHLNNIKIGVIYGLFVDAFKLGS